MYVYINILEFIGDNIQYVGRILYAIILWVLFVYKFAVSCIYILWYKKEKGSRIIQDKYIFGFIIHRTEITSIPFRVGLCPVDK